MQIISMEDDRWQMAESNRWHLTAIWKLDLNGKETWYWIRHNRELDQVRSLSTIWYLRIATCSLAAVVVNRKRSQLPLESRTPWLAPSQVPLIELLMQRCIIQSISVWLVTPNHVKGQLVIIKPLEALTPWWTLKRRIIVQINGRMGLICMLALIICVDEYQEKLHQSNESPERN